MEENRNRLRTAALKRRAAVDRDSCRGWARLIQRSVIDQPVYLAARTVAAYHPIGNEVDTGAIIDDALAHQKRVFVPESATDGRGRFVQLLSEKAHPQKYRSAGISVSANELADPRQGPLLVIVPGVLFDLQGSRLGRGGGWYDRTLQALGQRAIHIGLAYEFQLVSHIPTEEWDQKVHLVVTESRVIDHRRASSWEMVR
jgi:5-formyltetrahydrofolate cyclo-ligase